MLHGERIKLRPIRADDLPMMRGWFQERETAATWARHPVIAESHFESDLHGRFATFDRDGHFAVENEQGEFIGRIDYDDLNPIDRTAELSILIGTPDARSRGYGSDAMHTLIEHLFNDRQIERLWLSVIAFNLPAIRLYEKLGFVHEGALVQTVWLDDAWHDLLLMGMFRSEYRGRG